MTSTAFRITVPVSVVANVRELIIGENGRASEPQPASSTADPLNAPVSGGDIQSAALVITAVFSAGVSAVDFLRKLIALAKDCKGRVEITNVNKDKTVVIDKKTKIEDLN